jgi:hypothetical protein
VNISWWIRSTGHVARVGEVISICNILVSKPEPKVPFGGPRIKWKDNIRMDRKELGWEGED